MEVCNVCGSFLIVGDIQSRLDEHNSGKQHAGYAKIRSTLEDLIVSSISSYNYNIPKLVIIQILR